MKIKILLLFSSFLLLVVGIQPAQATLSIGPSGVHDKLESNMVAEHSFQIKRTYPDQVSNFVVELEDVDAAKYVDLHGQDSFAIERGEYGYDYIFTIDTTGAPEGKHEVDISFVQETADKEGSTMAVRYGVQGTIYFEVVDEFVPEDNPTNLSNTTDLITGLSIVDFKADKDIYIAGSEAVFNWEISNNLENEAFANTPVDIAVYYEGRRISGMGSTCNKVLAPGGVCEGEYVYDIPVRKNGEYSITLNVAGNIESLPFSIKIPFYQTNWFLGVFIGIGLICLLILYIYSDLLLMYIKYLHEHNKRYLRRGAKKMKQIRVLRYNKLAATAVVVILLFGVIGTYLSIPNIKAAEFPGAVNLMGQMVAFTNDQDGGMHLFRSRDLMLDYLSNGWVLYPHTDNNFFAIPEDVTQDFYLVTTGTIFQYDYSKLPGQITSVDVNKRKSLMLLQGTSGEDGTPYYCLSGIGVDNGPQCTYLQDLMDDSQVVEMGWVGEEDVVMISVDNKQYSYNYWSDQLVETDQGQAMQEIGVRTYQMAQYLTSQDSDWKMFYNILYNWKQKKAYRLYDSVRLYPLSDSYYLMVDEQGDLNMLDLEKEQHYYIDQVERGTRFYLIEEDYLITTP
jgi:hypothetical protein